MAVVRYREALNQALREEMQRDEKVFLMGEDIGVFNGAFKVTNGLLEEFGEKRVRDTPISENTIVGMGVGSAMTGLRPVVELMTINFSLLALDQIVNHAAHIHYMFGGQVRVPLVIRMPQGAGHQLGPTHSHSWEALFLHVPGLLEEFGEKRVRDTPISENTIVGMGVGAAMTGLRPVVELMTINFSLLAFDQIVNHAAHIRYMFGGQVSVPLVVRMPQGAGHQLGPTHSHCFESLYLHAPGLLVAVPATPADAKGLLKAAIRDDTPVVFIEHEYLYGQRGEVPDDDDHTVDFGQAAIRREGDDVTIVGILKMAHVAEEAATTLAHEHQV